MQKIEFKQLTQDWNAILSSVIDDQEPITVSMGKDKELVIMDAEDYRSLMETFHLLRSPDNAARLREGMRQHQTGVKKEMMDRIRQIAWPEEELR